MVLILLEEDGCSLDSVGGIGLHVSWNIHLASFDIRDRVGISGSQSNMVRIGCDVVPDTWLLQRHLPS